MLTIESKMVIIFWAHSPISFKHVSYWCHVLKATPKPNHSNRDGHLRGVSKLDIMKCSHLKAHLYYLIKTMRCMIIMILLFSLLILLWKDYNIICVFRIVIMSSLDGSTQLIHDISQEPINLYYYIYLWHNLAYRPSLSNDKTWCLRTS